MDSSDTSDRSQNNTKHSSGCVFKFGTLVFLTGTLLLLGFFVYTYLAPNNPYNPFPPAEGNSQSIPPTLEILPSHTPILIPTTTASLTPEILASTATLLPPPTEAVITILAPTTAPESALHFTAQTGTPVYTAHPNGCDGIYLAGNVIDSEGNPLAGMLVIAAGTLGDTPLETEPSLSGLHPEFSPSGWQIKLSDTLLDSSETVYVALYSLDSADPVSELVYVDTYNDCDRNMIMVNFVQQ
ncbi:MAG: hypothetical protein ABFS17_05730 [Chloroflexota bacterium]